MAKRNPLIPSSHKLHGVWVAMRQRCYNPNCESYPDYGARGILVCKEWKNSYLIFFEWAINNGYAVGKKIDRIDNDLGYSPENCRFVTTLRSLRNRRNVVLYEMNGNSRTIVEWAAYYDIPSAVLYNRIKNKKMPLEVAVSYKKKTKLDKTAETPKTIGETINKIIRKNGRFNKWIINKMVEGGYNITETKFTNKIKGIKDCFDKDEIDFIYEIFSKHKFEGIYELLEIELP